LDGSVLRSIGGGPFFVNLVDGFYAGVSADPLLRPLYPDDLTDSRRHLTPVRSGLVRSRCERFVAMGRRDIRQLRVGVAGGASHVMGALCNE